VNKSNANPWITRETFAYFLLYIKSGYYNRISWRVALKQCVRCYPPCAQMYGIWLLILTPGVSVSSSGASVLPIGSSVQKTRIHFFSLLFVIPSSGKQQNSKKCVSDVFASLHKKSYSINTRNLFHFILDFGSFMKTHTYSHWCPNFLNKRRKDFRISTVMKIPESTNSSMLLHIKQSMFCRGAEGNSLNRLIRTLNFNEWVL